jgi:hypothetical protein
MPYNGVGLFTSLGAPTFPAVPNTYILASYFNATMNDIFSGLSAVMTRDGQSPMTANLPMGGNKITGVADGTVAGDVVTYSQLFVAPSIANPTFTGVPTAPTAAPGTSTTQLATTEFIATSFAPLASPALTGTPTVPTAVPGTSTTQAATTEFVAVSYAPLASPALSGVPTGPTASAGSNTIQLATTAFVQTTAFSLTIPEPLEWASYNTFLNTWGSINSLNA